MYETKIDLFMDGFYTREINCIDIPLAACCGAINRADYFNFIFTLTIFSNFLSEPNNWFELRNTTMSLMGGKLSRHKCNSSKETFDFIIQALGDEKILLCIFKYGSLPYSRYYKTGTYDHGVILCGIDKKKELIKICDRELVRQYIESGIFTADVLSSQWITFSMLKKILYENEILFLENKYNMTEHYRMIYSVEPAIRNMEWSELKYRVAKAVQKNFSNNFCISFLEAKFDDPINSKALLQRSRRTFLISLSAVDRIFKNSESKNSELIEYWQVFLSNRQLLMNLALKDIYSDSSFDNIRHLKINDECYALQFLKVLGESNG